MGDKEALRDEPMKPSLADLLKDSAYRLDQFKPEHVAALEAGITPKEAGKAAAPYVTCLVRGKPIKLTPEEVVRQLYLPVLHFDLGYLRSRLPQLVFKWSQDGSNHSRFDERELLNLPVPRALIAGQATYETAVRQMVTLRQCTTRLLDAAKRAVEIAIEDSEAAALAHLAAAHPPTAAM